MFTDEVCDDHLPWDEEDYDVLACAISDRVTSVLDRVKLQAIVEVEDDFILAVRITCNKIIPQCVRDELQMIGLTGVAYEWRTSLVEYVEICRWVH